MARFALNPFRLPEPDWSAPELAFTEAIRRRDQLPLHRSLPGYTPTPLRDLPELATELDLASLTVKDESTRFGIDAFKGLGASYAIYSFLRRRWHDLTGGDLTVEAFADPTVRGQLGAVTFTAATDGNHGRAVAWTAGRLGQRAVIFMPDDTAVARVRAVESEGAEVRLVPGTFDDCVVACARTAKLEAWQVIADTAYPGYVETPGHIMTGYSTIFAEIAEQTDHEYDAVFLPVGVGGLAAAGTVSLVQQFGVDRPRLICVEPDDSACFLESIDHGDGRPHQAAGDQRSVMVGLCCGLPSLLAWPVLRDGMDLFLGIEDEYAFEAMRAYHRHGVTSGESGAACLAGLLALLKRDDLEPARRQLGLETSSRVLVINTEGATDPENYAQVIGEIRNRNS